MGAGRYTGRTVRRRQDPDGCFQTHAGDYPCDDMRNCSAGDTRSDRSGVAGGDTGGSGVGGHRGATVRYRNGRLIQPRLCRDSVGEPHASNAGSPPQQLQGQIDSPPGEERRGRARSCVQHNKWTLDARSLPENWRYERKARVPAGRNRGVTTRIAPVRLKERKSQV